MIASERIWAIVKIKLLFWLDQLKTSQRPSLNLILGLLYLTTANIVSLTVNREKILYILLAMLANFVIYILMVIRLRSFDKKWIWLLLLSLVTSLLFLGLPQWNSNDANWVLGASANHIEDNVNFYTTSFGEARSQGVTLAFPSRVNYNITYPYGYLYFEGVNLLYRIGKNIDNTRILLQLLNLFCLQISILLLAQLLRLNKSKLGYSSLLILIGLNPFLLQDFITNIHQEMVALPFVLLSLIFLIKRKYLLFSLLLILALLIKTSFLFYGIFTVVYIWQQLVNPQRRIIFALGSLLMAIGLSLPYPLFYDVMPWHPTSVATTSVFFNTPVYFLLIPLLTVLPQAFNPDSPVFGIIASALTVTMNFIFGIFILRMICKSRLKLFTLQDVWVYTLVTYLLYNFVFGSALLSWHLLWSLPLWLLVLPSDISIKKLFIYGSIVLLILQFMLIHLNPSMEGNYVMICIMLILVCLLKAKELKKLFPTIVKRWDL